MSKLNENNEIVQLLTI